jgi:hypothetical protein
MCQMGVALDWKLRANRLKRERNMVRGSGHRRIVPPYVIAYVIDGGESLWASSHDQNAKRVKIMDKS